MKRLVELDPDTLYSKEVDVVRLREEAKQLRELLLALPPQWDKENLRGKLIPMCDAVLNNDLALPLAPGTEPISITRILDSGGKLPEQFEDTYARFINTALGARVDPYSVFEKNGKSWGWMEIADGSKATPEAGSNQGK